MVCSLKIMYTIYENVVYEYCIPYITIHNKYLAKYTIHIQNYDGLFNGCSYMGYNALKRSVGEKLWGRRSVPPPHRCPQNFINFSHSVKF